MAQFEPGSPKPAGSGRRKGTPNTRTLHLMEALESIDFNVPERLIRLLPELAADKQAEILVELMGYLFPKRKATELSLTVPAPVEEDTEEDCAEREEHIKKMMKDFLYLDESFQNMVARLFLEDYCFKGVLEKQRQIILEERSQQIGPRGSLPDVTALY